MSARRRLGISIAAGMLAASVPVIASAPQAQATGCASVAEYRSLPVNATKTPPWVAHHFGVQGRKVSEYGRYVNGRWTWTTILRYPACASGHRVFVTFVGWYFHPATAIKKTYS